jgi:hypothetical protein
MQDEPQPFLGDDFYMKAFWDLSTERQLGMTAGPIPWTRIQAYACACELSSSMMKVFEAVIRAMDSTYMEEAEKARKKSAKNKRGAAQSYIGDTRERKAKT